MTNPPTPLTIGDAEVQKSIHDFLLEARHCAVTIRPDVAGILGFAALSTVFCCVIAAGEALCACWRPDEVLVKRFYDEMPDQTSWLLPPAGTQPDPAKTCEVLKDVRNGIAHALSLPPDVRLLPNRQSAQLYPADRWQLIVPEFVAAVADTIAQISQKQPSLNWGAVVRSGRAPAGAQPPPQQQPQQVIAQFLSTAGPLSVTTGATATSTPTGQPQPPTPPSQPSQGTSITLPEQTPSQRMDASPTEDKP